MHTKTERYNGYSILLWLLYLRNYRDIEVSVEPDIGILALLVLNCAKCSGCFNKRFGNKIYTGKIKSHERRMGPFKVNGREFTVILKLLEYQGASKGFDETVESLSIVDKKGEVHYQKSFDVEYRNGSFAESLGINVYALDRGEKGDSSMNQEG